jgi:hypothetical protein
MALANVGVISVTQTGTFPLYNTTTDGLNKTVFTSPGRTANIIFDTTAVSTGANVAYSNSTGVFTLDGNLTYQLTATTRVLNWPSTADEPPAIEWYNITSGARIGLSVAIPGTNVTMFKPTATTQIQARAAASSTILNLQWQYPASLQRASATVSSVSGWTE